MKEDYGIHQTSSGDPLDDKIEDESTITSLNKAQ